MTKTVNDVFDDLLDRLYELDIPKKMVDQISNEYHRCFASAMTVATEAQEQCLYCHYPELPIMQFRIKEGRAGTIYKPTVGSFDGVGLLIDAVKRLEPYGEFVEFQYCPICGRRLEVEKDV